MAPKFSRRVIAGLVAVLVLIGFSALGSAFVTSMTPGVKAVAEARVIPVHDLRPGAVKIVELIALGGGSAKGLILHRDRSDAIRAWSVMLKDGAVGMPEFSWVRMTHFCKRFGARIEADVEVLSCQDEQLPQYWATQWRWRADGTNLDGKTDDLEPEQGLVSGDLFQLGVRELR